MKQMLDAPDGLGGQGRPSLGAWLVRPSRQGHRAVALALASLLLLQPAAFAASVDDKKPTNGYTRAPVAATPERRAPDTRPAAPPSDAGANGYRRVTPSQATPAAPLALPRSSVTDALGGEQSERSYRDYRRREEPPPVAAAPSRPERDTSPGQAQGGPSSPGAWGTAPGGGWGAPRRQAPPPSDYDYPPARQPAQRDWGWSPAPSVQRPTWQSALLGRRQYGGWKTAALAGMLAGVVTVPAYAMWFHHHEFDPGYISWRADADRLAATDDDLRDKLRVLDSRLSALNGEPRDPAFVPPGMTAEELGMPSPAATVAAQEERPAVRRTPAIQPVSTPAPSTSGGHSWLVWLLAVLVFVGVVAAALALLRRRPAGRSSSVMRPTDLAATVIRQKVTGDKPAPISPWRVGMPINLDETPFILADDKLVTPKPGSDKGYVAAVGRLRHNTASLVRLYLDGTTFLQADLNPKGDTAELWRLFRQLDVVNPTTADDWEQWLGAEGMIGWPTFQTKDGVVFTERVWAPSESRIAPFDFQETVEGDREPAKHTMMLYARSTGLADPAPQVEYALLELVERDGKRWIEIHAGIDVSPASLGII